MPAAQASTAIVTCNDLDASEAFYTRLGFKRDGWDDHYRILLDGKGAEIHLLAAEDGRPVPGRNPFPLYLFTEDVDELASLSIRSLRISPGICTSSPSQTRMGIM